MAESIWTKANEGDAVGLEAVKAFGFGRDMGRDGDTTRPLPVEKMNGALRDPGRVDAITLGDWAEVGWMVGQNDFHPVPGRRSLMVGDRVRVVLRTASGELVEMNARVDGLGFSDFNLAPVSAEALAVME